MNKQQFERKLFSVMDGYFGGDQWKDKNGHSFDWAMDELALECSDEQWQIVDDTMALLHDPDYIIGEAPLETPVSPNPWEHMQS